MYISLSKKLSLTSIEIYQSRGLLVCINACGVVSPVSAYIYLGHLHSHACSPACSSFLWKLIVQGVFHMKIFA